MRSKYYFFILSILAVSFLSGCQQERLSVTDGQEQDNLLDDANLVGLVQGVTAHDGSHDNLVDNSSCFSINFPYYCEVDGEVFYYQQASDLDDLYRATEINPVFPVTLTYADYGEIEVGSSEEFQDLIALCSNGFLYNEAILCVDFIYPIELAIYDTQTADFETVIYDHDRITFRGISDLLLSGKIAQFKYPMQMDITNGETLQINSDSDLKSIINSNLNFCD